MRCNAEGSMRGIEVEEEEKILSFHVLQLPDWSKSVSMSTSRRTCKHAGRGMKGRRILSLVTGALLVTGTVFWAHK